MKKLNQNGIAHLALILLAGVVLAGAGFAGWRVYESSTKQTSQKTNSKNETQESNTNKAQGLSDTEILDLSDSPISLKKPEDTDKLSAKTPASFIAMLKAKLAEFKCEDSEGGYGVSKISKNVVSGGVSCMGGAAYYWYLQNGSWESLGLQSTPSCSDLKATNIPLEFIDKCLDENSIEMPNPNGSIKD